jgi:hypothetical protein
MTTMGTEWFRYASLKGSRDFDTLDEYKKNDMDRVFGNDSYSIRTTNVIGKKRGISDVY